MTIAITLLLAGVVVILAGVLITLRLGGRKSGEQLTTQRKTMIAVVVLGALILITGFLLLLIA